jgi:2-polyprenyl-6-methoxyphenol hydroxylase-like FAD-dependent oxidoreductase
MVRIDDLTPVDTDVLVVGAGPTGLMAALVLNRRGVPNVLIDYKQGPTRESRALAVHPRTMEIYDQLGLVERVQRQSVEAGRLVPGRGGGVLVADAQRSATRFPGVHLFPQDDNEALLAEALADGGGDLRWQHRLLSVVRNEPGAPWPVEALADGPAGLTRIRAKWCIGADGAASTVRRLLDIPFEGVTDDATFWVADVHDLTGIDNTAVVALFGRTSFVIIFPLDTEPGHVRLIALAPTGHIDEDGARRLLADDIGATFGAIDWFSPYRVHHRVAARFRSAAVFLAGDAGHVHSPVGGQGMNTGLQDAHNVALLLADISQNRLHPSAIDRYQSERRRIALKLINATDRVFTVVAGTGRIRGFVRRYISALPALVIPPLMRTGPGRRLAGLLGQYRIRYHFVDDDAAVPEWAADPCVGLRLAPVADNNLQLRSLSWQLHTYGVSVERPELPDWIDGPYEFGRDPQRNLRSDRLYLIRPDGFVAAAIPVRGGKADPGQLGAAVAAHHLAL